MDDTTNSPDLNSTAGQPETISTPGQAYPQGTGTLTVGNVLSRTWNILTKNIVLYLSLAVIPTAASFLGDLLTESAPLLGSLLNIASTFLGMLIQAAIAYAVYKSLCGEHATSSEAIQKGMKRFIPVLLASIVVGLLTGIGYLLFIVPGLIITCIYAVTIPACVVEHTGAIDSMRRSAILTKGSRWTIFALIAVVMVVIFAISGGIMTLAVAAVDSWVAVSLLANIIILVPTAFQNVMVAVIYYTLREVREGVSVESLANVFD